MKSPKWLLGLAAGLVLGLSGCNQTATVDTEGFEKAFASAPAEVKGHADKVAAAVKAQKYKDALYALDPLLATNGTVTLPAAQLDAARKMSLEINQVVLQKKSL